MKQFLSYLLAGTLILVTSVPAFAKGGKPDDSDKGGSKGKSSQIRLNMSLAPSNPLLTDLASASGELSFKSKSKGDAVKSLQLKLKLSIPVLAPSLGIADLATAQAADINAEFLREGVAFATCKLALQGGDDEEVPTSLRFRLHAKIAGKSPRTVKGECAGGAPEMQAGDTVSVFANVAGVRVDFLAGQ